nr:hypothetical protein [Synechococcus sp. CS-1329]
MTVVLDASAALAWIFERDNPMEAEEAQRLLDHFGSGQCLGGG